MKVEKTIDPQEKSMKKVFDALTKHCEKYPEDFATLYVGRRVETEDGYMLKSSSFILGDNKEHFFKSHIWQMFKLMEVSSVDSVKEIYNHALNMYHINKEI